MKSDDLDDPHGEFADLARKLWELERDHDEEDLYPNMFMQEFTDFPTWDEFKRRLAATPRRERDAFVTQTTRFGCYEEMEGMALERLVVDKLAREDLEARQAREVSGDGDDGRMRALAC